MKLTVHLARHGITTFDGLIKEKYLDSDGYEPLEPSEALDFPLRAYVQRVRTSEPKWVGFLREYFDIEDLQNSFASFVLLTSHNGRVFALTFGQGFHTIERSRFEPNFGLRVAGNALDGSAVKTIDTRNLDTVTRQQRTQLSIGSDLTNFELDLGQEWVRKLSGISSDLDFARSVSGSDAVTLNLDLKLEDLPTVLDKLLDLHGRDDYRERFGFIDNYRSLRKDDPVVSRLDEALRAKIAQRDHEKISLAYPEIIDDEDVAYVHVTANRRSTDLTDLSLDAIYGVLEGARVPDPLKQVYIVPINDAGDAVGARKKLREYLVSELEIGDKTYVLSLDDWFEVNRDYVATVNSEVAKISDLTSTLSLPAWHRGKDEGAYNEEAAKQLHWTLLDKKNYQIGGRNQKLEVCDLLSPAKHMVCVKKMTKSATLSHLFSQGSVSAELYRGEEDYRQRLEAALPANPGNGTLQDGDPTIVYAIATERPGPIADVLFFFSKVNLIGQAKAVRRCGLHVAIAKIDLR